MYKNAFTVIIVCCMIVLMVTKLFADKIVRKTHRQLKFNAKDIFD